MISSCSSRGVRTNSSYFVPIKTGIAVLAGCELRAQQPKSCTHLVESSSLPVPLLDAVECMFLGEVKHEKNGDGIVRDEWEHGDELSLAT